MFDITTDEVKLIEDRIFPTNDVFDDDQKKVLLSNSSSNVVACPGSGKTTVLIAKIAILLKKSNLNSEKGICIITHTNVGVEEIKTRLKELGIESINYPHFIGTIQEFFNNFFARKAYALLFNNKKRLTFLEEDEYIKYFIRAFEQFKPSWYKAKPPVQTMRECNIKFDDKNQAYLTNFSSTNREYINSIVNSLLYLIDEEFCAIKSPCHLQNGI